MKRMLINATQQEELRVAIAEGQTLFDLDIEVPSQEQKKSNVYKGRITRVEPSLEACFIEFGSARHGFLPLKEICPAAYSKDAQKKTGKVAIRDVVKEGQEIIVQVEKEERGNKGAALTTYISLAGRYLVLMPTNPTAGGVSRRITGTDRDHLREQLQQVTAPNNVGIIVRTAGVGRDANELQWDLDYLMQLWTAIEQAATKRAAPFLIYQESNLFIRALRDHLRNDIGEILVDNEDVYNDAREFMQQVMPHNLNKLKLYSDPVPLFSRYQIESQIESAFARTVHLPSGGAVVIDHTEALLSIDINSARATKGSDIEETAYNTNMESAQEIARQLRLRDLGGLIVIDFIDMTSRKHQRDVEECLRDAMQVDKARVQIGRISRFGLLEMSRQRLRPSLGESSQETCPRCDGQGSIRSVESLSLSILRLVEEEVMKDFTGQIVVQAPTEVINFLHNEKRAALASIEKRHSVPIMVLANEHLVTPHFEIHRVKAAEVSDVPSYQRIEQPESQLIANERSQANVVVPPTPAVSRPTREQPAPSQVAEKAPGLFSRLASRLFSGAKEEQKKSPVTRKTTAKKTSSRRRSPQARSGDQQSRGQQAHKKTGKKQTGRRNQQRNQQRAGKKQSSKKAQSKPVQNQDQQAHATQADASTEQSTQAQPKQNKGQQRRRRPPRNRQQAANKVQTDATMASVPDTQAAVQTSNDVDGNVMPDQNDSSSHSSNRRRRSPYKTGGSKPRPERNASQGDKPVEASQQQPSSDKKTPPVNKPDQKPEHTVVDNQTSAMGKAVITETVSSEVSSTSISKVTKPSQPAEKPAESSASAVPKAAESDKKVAAASSKQPAGKATGDDEKPVKASRQTSRKKSTARKAADTNPDQVVSSDAGVKKTKEKSSKKTEAKPRARKPTTFAQPQEGAKGLYTLKPEPPKTKVSADSET